MPVGVRCAAAAAPPWPVGALERRATAIKRATRWSAATRWPAASRWSAATRWPAATGCLGGGDTARVTDRHRALLGLFGRVAAPSRLASFW